MEIERTRVDIFGEVFAAAVLGLRERIQFATLYKTLGKCGTMFSVMLQSQPHSARHTRATNVHLS